MDANRIHKSAVWYANHGWYVVPLHAPLFDDKMNCIGCTCEEWRRKNKPGYVCPTPGKHPVIREWEDNATIDAATINNWWHRWPWANVGVAPGRSGLLALDLDTYKDFYEGEKLLSDADEQTVTNITGSGGTHLIYAMPEDAHYTNANAKLPSGIDIRGFGGQFVAPPSIHPSGQRYQWEAGYGPHEIAVAQLPQHIQSILDTQVEAITASVQFSNDVQAPNLEHIHLRKEIVDLIRSNPVKGQRSENDQKVITALVNAGATDNEIKAVFQLHNIGTNGKFAEKGDNALRYLAHSIAHARGWITQRRVERFFEMATK